VASRRAASNFLSLGLVAILIGAFAVQTVLPAIHSAERITLIQQAGSSSPGSAQAVLSISPSSRRSNPPSKAHDPVSCPICWSLLHAGAAVASAATRPVLTTQDLQPSLDAPSFHSSTVVEDEHPPRAPPFENRPLV